MNFNENRQTDIIHEGIVNAYICLKKYSKAIAHIGEAYKTQPSEKLKELFDLVSYKSGVFPSPRI